MDTYEREEKEMNQTMEMPVDGNTKTKGEYLLAVVEGDVSNPVQYAVSASDMNRDTLRRFIEGWLEETDRTGDFSDELIDEIVDGMRYNGYFWDDQTWCFQIFRGVKEI